MHAAAHPDNDRATGRLLRDCKTLGGFGDVDAPSASERLEDALGSDLAGLLLSALAPRRRAAPTRAIP